VRGYILLKVDFLNSKVKTEEVLKIIQDNHYKLSNEYNSKITNLTTQNDILAHLLHEMHKDIKLIKAKLRLKKFE
jgi:hypothetical protein